MFRPVLVVGDPILAKEVMVNQFQNFPDHRFRGDSIKQIGGKMLFTLRHDDWRRVRAIVSPSFSTAKLKALIETMNGAVSTLISNIEKAVKNNQTVDMKIYLCSLTLDIISSCAFGVKIDSLQDPNNSIVDNSNKLFANNISWLSLFAFMSPSLAPVGSALGISIFDVKALKYFQFLIYELIQKRVQLLSSSSQSTSSRKDFIQLLMEGEIRANEYSDSRRKLTKEEIVDQGILFILAGHESTATTLAALVFLLAKNPEKQDKLCEELDKLSEDDVLDFETIKKLRYLDAVVQESLRMMPPVPRIERRAVQNCQLGDIPIEKGTLITIPVYTIHRDPDNYELPDSFIPERFVDSNADKMPAFIPFASGPRNCIGERFAYLVLKLCTIRLFRRFQFEICDETKEPFDYYTGSLVSSPKEVKLKPIDRQKNEFL